MMGMGRSLNVSHSVCACLCLFFSACPSARWFHPSEWGSALGSHLSCLMGRQELVGSMDNPPTSPRWMLGALRIFLPLFHFGSFWGPSCQGQ